MSPFPKQSNVSFSQMNIVVCVCLFRQFRYYVEVLLPINFPIPADRFSGIFVVSAVFREEGKRKRRSSEKNKMLCAVYCALFSL